jgi:L,D-transpeptidase ErfK/SrfK
MAALRMLAAATTLAIAACSVFVPEQRAPSKPAATVRPTGLPPVATHSFPYDPKTTGVVGLMQVTYSRGEDTLFDIARRFDLGIDEVTHANPGVDPWLPGDGTRILLPTQFVLPDAPHDGLVINIAALRMFYFPKPAKGEQRVVMTFPLGIGKIGWATPTGTTKIVSKRTDPIWTPPASVRKEHEEDGDPLPAQVPPGPDNPLGRFAMNLGWPTYLIHGTNKPAGVGLRASHGCIRMLPEDIAAIYEDIPVGMKVTVVDQSLLYRWQGGALYVQSYPPHAKSEEEESAGKQPVFNEAMLAKMMQRAKPHGGQLDAALVKQVVDDQLGVAVPVSRAGLTYDNLVAGARVVENQIPEGSNWDGTDEYPDTEEQPVATTDEHDAH